MGVGLPSDASRDVAIYTSKWHAPSAWKQTCGVLRPLVIALSPQVVVREQRSKPELGPYLVLSWRKRYDPKKLGERSSQVFKIQSGNIYISCLEWEQRKKYILIYHYQLYSPYMHFIMREETFAQSLITAFKMSCKAFSSGMKDYSLPCGLGQYCEAFKSNRVKVSSISWT
jgi:hypothetical protein